MIPCCVCGDVSCDARSERVHAMSMTWKRGASVEDHFVRTTMDQTSEDYTVSVVNHDSGRLRS